MSYSGRIGSRESYRADALSAGDAYARAQPAGADLREFFAVLHRHWKFIAISLTTAMLLAAAHLITTGTAYTATVSILIDPRTRAPVGADPGNGPMGSPDAAQVESQVKLIASDAVLRRVAQQERLTDDPDFVPTKPGLRTRLFSILGLGSSAPAGEDRLTRAAAALARSTTVKRSERTYIVEVDVASGSPNKAARLANLVAETYIAEQRDRRSQVTRQDTQWLTQRLSDLQSRLQQAETKVQEYKVKNRITDAVGKNVREQELSDLTNELTRARARSIEAKAKYDQVQKLASSGRSPESMLDALKSPVLEKLRAQFAEIVRQDAHYRTTLGDRHPAMLEVQNQMRDARRLITAELTRISGSAANEYQQARAAEQDTARRVETARLSIESKNETLVPLRELEREVEAQRLAYEKFLRARETIQDDTNDGPNAHIIALATAPLAPSSPKTMAILFIAMMSGLCFGIGGSLLRAYINTAPDPLAGQNASRRGSHPREATASEEFALEVIASVPRIYGEPAKHAFLPNWMPGRKSAGTTVDLSVAFAELQTNPGSAFSQAILSLYESIAPEAEPRARVHKPTRVLVCSAHEKCGKTTIAVNLARAAAAAGKRTLLIDANVNHPSLAALPAANAEPALIELSGALRPIYRVDGDAARNLHVVPIVANEEKFCRDLASRATAKKFRGINDNFDFVVIDGPALDDGDNLRLMAGAVNRIILVATNAEQPLSVDEWIEALDVPEARLAGTVVSMSAPKRAA